MIKQLLKIIFCIGIFSVQQTEAIGFPDVKGKIQNAYQACKVAKNAIQRVVQHRASISKLIAAARFIQSLGLIKTSILIALIIYFVYSLVVFIKDVCFKLGEFLKSPIGNSFLALQAVIGFLLKSMAAVVIFVAGQVGARILNRGIDAAISKTPYFGPLLVPARA